ncbi:YicC/YloC family endoribonuclease [Paenibacillus cremeus]|uniref:YicC family protein n=1 Tax=Paenibacillus cremeus TaxID=2163881 RepID=A0A559K9E4_9BACL|nr:YicC/YloC family endoribonuclease [Paenibacillus cremeus]TVY08739.1 YicC family protein [Paenibacillus cremeus]
MVLSMTGFGQASVSVAGFQLRIDLKSVNHRYCEVAVRMPREWARYEDAVKQAVLQLVKRGRVDAFVTIERERQSSQAIEIDWDLAAGYMQAAEQLRERFGLTDQLTLKDLLSLPDLVAMKELPDTGDEHMRQAIVACATQAAQELLEMRAREGAFLLADLEQRLAGLERSRQEAAVLAPQAVKEHAEKLRTRIQELLQQEAPDESRLAMEVAVFADRVAIDEELTRLHSHCGQFKGLLHSREPVGRKLDFLVQEMNREVNTIGSKANHASLTALVVDMKAELEKMREQIQNIE